jgi:hypothetical protein
MNTPHSNGHRGTSPWRTQTVHAFFSALPWTGAAPQQTWAGALGTAPDRTQLSLRATVSTFFCHFPWEGTPTIGAPLAPLEIQPEASSAPDALTLDSFSDLF